MVKCIFGFVAGVVVGSVVVRLPLFSAKSLIRFAHSRKVKKVDEHLSRILQKYSINMKDGSVTRLTPKSTSPIVQLSTTPDVLGTMYVHDGDSIEVRMVKVITDENFS